MFSYTANKRALKFYWARWEHNYYQAKKHHMRARGARWEHNYYQAKICTLAIRLRGKSSWRQMNGVTHFNRLTRLKTHCSLMVSNDCFINCPALIDSRCSNSTLKFTGNIRKSKLKIEETIFLVIIVYDNLLFNSQMKSLLVKGLWMKWISSASFFVLFRLATENLKF